ncbi:translocator protein-like isoform X1 [Mytilus trossulus]|uniref:translocator protein-like isoform X1 n=2 Tax=Mytilus trossulus TaxID=6551 RepID=UPI0030042373
MSKMSEYIAPVGATLLPHIGGVLGGFVSRKNMKTWFEHLEKPSWKPPNWVFGPVWTTLYTSMGYASYMVWRDGGGFNGEATLPLALYGSQLALNWAWSPLFFGAHKIGASLIEMGFLWGTAGACGYAFGTINRTAGLLFIPYMAWLTLATALTYRIWKDNKDKID